MAKARRMLLATLLLTGLLVVGGPMAPAGATCAIGSPAPAFSAQVQRSAVHARVWRLYQAFFLRQPDDGGFAYWARVHAQGARLTDIAYQFAVGPEFVARYGNLSNGQFVNLVYSNVLCRTPDQGGYAYWTGLLDSGALTRWDLMINFVELSEYLTRTGTCQSIYPAQSALVPACPESHLTPLSSATVANDGYQAVSVGFRSGSFQGVVVDLSRPGVFETGRARCSVASINANWLVASEKDGPNPGVLGLGVVDGAPVKGSADRTDRGVFGLRFDANPQSVVEVWPGDTLSADDVRLNSVMYHSGAVTLEQWHASAETSPYLHNLAPGAIVDSSAWAWAAAGIPLIVDGQTDRNLSAAIASDPYTYSTLRHTFVAVDQDYNRLFFGGTANLTVRDLVDWANQAGYEDLIKFDGGGSAEYNVAGQAVVAGTSRNIPVWLGIGC